MIARIYWRRRLTRLEAALYSIAVLAALAIFLERSLYYMEAAERSMMETTVTRVNSALRLRAARALLAGQAVSAGEERASPFGLTGVVPSNFRGETDLLSAEVLERGTWVYDRLGRELVYLPQLHRELRTADPAGAIRFRLSPKGDELVPAHPYAWG